MRRYLGIGESLAQEARYDGGYTFSVRASGRVANAVSRSCRVSAISSQCECPLQRHVVRMSWISDAAMLDPSSHTAAVDMVTRQVGGETLSVLRLLLSCCHWSSAGYEA